MAEVGWDEVTYLTKRTPKAGEMRSQQVKFQLKLFVCIFEVVSYFNCSADDKLYLVFIFN
jgi:hypothetical protein